MASPGLPSDDNGDHHGRKFVFHPHPNDELFFLHNITYKFYVLKKVPRSFPLRDSLAKIIRMHHECEGGKEKSVPRITDWHHDSCQVMIYGDHDGRVSIARQIGIYRWVGARCLSVAGPTVAQLEVFFSSDYL